MEKAVDSMRKIYQVTRIIRGFRLPEMDPETEKRGRRGHLMGHLIGKKYMMEHLLEVAKNIVLAIHKAPQITGKTSIETEILWGEDLEPILAVIEPVAKAARYFLWDYETLKRCCDKGESPVVINIGATVNRSNLNWNCGACGFPTCKEFNSYAREQGSGQLGGPSCNWKILDFAIACDWACAAAWQYKVDNRIMGSIGFALQAPGLSPQLQRQARPGPRPAQGHGLLQPG